MRITDEQFDRTVIEIAKEDGVEALLRIPGVWELVSEELNNEALKRLEKRIEKEQL